MYSDLFDQLGAGAGSSSRGRGGGGDRTESTEPAPVVACKAGKIRLTPGSAESSSSAPPRFRCEPDPTRGEIRLVWKNSALQWQWYDRRDKRVVDTVTVTDDLVGTTFERVDLAHYGRMHEHDRIYVWTRNAKAGVYEMYWMQDLSDEAEDETVGRINQFLADPASAAPEDERPDPPSRGGPSTSIPRHTNNTTSTSTTTTTTTTTGTITNNNNNQSPVDALSSILENLGMPPSGDTSSANSVGPAAEGGGGTTTSTRTLTLADLQGAMATIQAARSVPGPPLAEVVTASAITALLADETARQRLMELMPEEQRTPEFLEANLRSPQVQQTLRSLTSALLPEDDPSDWSGLYSILANFQLDVNHAQAGLAANNPIQAFLDAILQQQQQLATSEPAASTTAADHPEGPRNEEEEDQPMSTDEDAANKEPETKDSA